MTNIISGALSAEQQQLLNNFTSTLTNEQINWTLGYLTGLLQTNNSAAEQNSASLAVNDAIPTISSSSATPIPLTILYGSRTGNGEGLAEEALKIATEKGFHATVKSMADYNTRDLSSEKNLIVIVSTHGEGVPPFAARELHQFIHGKRAPKLNDVNFAVLGLGDATYFHFCKTGAEFDKQLDKLGAKRVAPFIACDVDFDEPADQWIRETLQIFKGGEKKNDVAQPTNSTPNTKKTEEAPKFNKKNPFSALVFEKVQLHGKGSDRQTIHLELDLANSGISYEPGDAAGVLPVNPTVLINEVLTATALTPEIEVEVGGEKKSLYEALYRDVELSKITTDVVTRYIAITKNEKLTNLSKNHDEFKAYLDGRDIVDLLQDYPTKLNAQELINLLKPLQPRYYSISSSPAAVPGELHLTVGVVKYKNAGRDKRGTCSSFLSEVAVEDEHVPLFIEKNPGFRLPENPETPIIMIGAGTGIAPYRAFVQHRELTKNAGKSWLFFGNRNFETEFLYQLEWQNFLKSGALTKMDVAFSRDGNQKEYVQDKLIQNSKEIFNWLENGAHVYICGDMKKMAGDVQNTLLKIVENQGNMDEENAQEYVDNLQKEKRLQLDVY